MGIQYRKSKTVAPGTRVNLSKSGASVSRSMGPLTVNTRGRSSLRILPGWSFRMGRNASGAMALVMFTVTLVAFGVWLLWAVVKLTWLMFWLPTVWAWRLARAGVRRVQAGRED